MDRRITTLNQHRFKAIEEENKQKQTKRWMDFLGFPNWDSYVRWCHANKYAASLDKAFYILEEEKQQRQEEEQLKQQGTSKQNLGVNDARIQAILGTFEASKEPQVSYWLEFKRKIRVAVLNLIEPPIKVSGDENRYANAFIKLAKVNAKFLKSMAEVNIKKSNPLAYFHELVKSLVVKYDVPQYFVSWWFMSGDSWSQGFVELVQGEKVYDVFKRVEPIPLTHHQIQLLMKGVAKNTYNYELARLRVILASLNAPKAMEREIEKIEDFKELLHEGYDLKINFFKFLIKEAHFFNWNHTQEVWDYIKEIADVNTFSFKGRRLQTLLEQVQVWHAQLRKETVVNDDKTEWKKSYLKNYLFSKKEEQFLIEEILKGKDLYQEGKKMRHCVYSYSGRCQKGEVAIFSMTKKFEHSLKSYPVATIEINLKTKAIVQFKAECNKAPDATAKFHLVKWATQEGLELKV